MGVSEVEIVADTRTGRGVDETAGDIIREVEEKGRVELASTRVVVTGTEICCCTDVREIDCWIRVAVIFV